MINKQDEVILQKFGAHIRRIREDKGMSLRQLSYSCNIDNSKISKIEQGKVNVTVLTIIDLAMGLEISPVELLNFKKSG